MAVRSLALLQLVKRTPFRRRHAFRDWGKKNQRSKTELLTFTELQGGGHERRSYLSGLPQNLNVLALLGVHVLAQQFKQLWQTGGAVRAGQA